MKKDNTGSIKYRIVTSDGKIKFAGTGRDSWFDLETARRLVDYENDEMIYESDGKSLLWEIL